MKENPTYSLKELLLYFLKLGTIGFGGPVALVGYMHQDLVENRKWISEEEYKDRLAVEIEIINNATRAVVLIDEAVKNFKEYLINLTNVTQAN